MVWLSTSFFLVSYDSKCSRMIYGSLAVNSPISLIKQQWKLQTSRLAQFNPPLSTLLVLPTWLCSLYPALLRWRLWDTLPRRLCDAQSAREEEELEGFEALQRTQPLDYFAVVCYVCLFVLLVPCYRSQSFPQLFAHQFTICYHSFRVKTSKMRMFLKKSEGRGILPRNYTCKSE